ncbi:hypothetical protein EV363DRAFT_1374332 [Boletus edulis]|uniref:F-box domain-containing protein n=1 Tax=Boletus edulis BED1 TaxID=1328754 RepID=A0AAD4G9J7_BOLED|nr:hypothetical protein EV363DRAFT_1374332 [Boletus edulis]KAF8431490.1 hypothetical protein L210DRAFT_3560576 [Boletus edulis BED1]
MGISHLPPELILIIFEHAYHTPAGSPDYALLATCSLVCTLWSIQAQPLLFHKSTKLRSHAIASFHAALMSSAVRGKPMGHAVRSLDISVGGSLAGACQPQAFAQLLQACPRLYELSLSVRGLHDFDQFALAKLKDAGQRIRALNLQECGVQSPVLFQLLGIWHRIQFLKIGTEIAAWPWRQPATTPVLRRPQANGGPDTTPQRPPARVSLYDLALSRIPQLDVLAWLLGSSVSSLCILDLHEMPGVAARQTLGIHAPHLRSLRLLQFTPQSAAFLSQCTRLEELVVYNIPIIVPLAPGLPPSIEHFSFRNPSHAFRDTLHPIIHAIEVLPKLRILTCDKNSEGLRDFETLKAKCTARGVEVVITDTPFWVYEDPTVVSRFPRRRSVSNFRLMTS